MEGAPLPSPLPARASQGEGAGGFHDGVVSKMARALAFLAGTRPESRFALGRIFQQQAEIPLTRPDGHPLPIGWGEGQGEGSSEILQTGLDSVVVQRCALRALSFTLTTDYPLDTLAPWQNLL